MVDKFTRSNINTNQFRGVGNVHFFTKKNIFNLFKSNNFKIIHIDTSVSPLNKKISINKSLNRFYELFEHCNIFAQKEKKRIFFEIGTEEQSGSTNTPDELEYTLNEIAIMTRAAPAKILGLDKKGNLSNGSDADITIYDKKVKNSLDFIHWKKIIVTNKINMDNMKDKYRIYI